MPTFIRAFCVAFFGLFAGCVTVPQPGGLTADYYEIAIGPDVFRIMYRGTDWTDRERNLDMALLQACRLVHGTDFLYFAVLDEDASRPGVPIYYPGLNHLTFQPHRGIVIRCFASRPKGVFTFKGRHLERILQKKLNLTS